MSCCDNGNEPLGSRKFWDFLNYLRNYLLFKKDSALWNWLVSNMHAISAKRW